MILLDTNVVSEVMRPAPAQAVLDWMDGTKTARLYLSTVSIAEIRYGLRIMPAGRRRRDLEDRFERFVAHGFEQRLLAFDDKAARCYGDLRRSQRASSSGSAPWQCPTRTMLRGRAIRSTSRAFPGVLLDLLHRSPSSRTTKEP